jgi:hypothetical protein
VSIEEDRQSILDPQSQSSILVILQNWGSVG